MNCRYFVLSAAILTGMLPAADAPVINNAWKALDEGLHANRLEHREQAVEAVATLPGSNERAVQKVVALLQHDGSVRVRQTAALALGEMKAQSAVPALKKALTDKPEVAFAAAKSLTEMGDPAGERYMMAVLNGKDKTTPGMESTAVRKARSNLLHPQNLVMMGGTTAAGFVFPPAGVGMAAAMQTKNLRSHGGSGRAAAASYVAKSGDPASITVLETALKDNNPAVQIAAAKGLGDLGNPASIGHLTPLLGNSHPGVAAMAAASIIRLSH